MHLDHLWLTDFRSYETAELKPAPAGLTLVVGPNGEGKTNLLEAVGYLATMRSFRGAPGEALVRVGADSAVVRANGERDGRRLLVEAELRRSGRDRVQINRQPLNRTRDLLDAWHTTVFTPDDLTMVKGGPSHRRDYLDDLLVSLHPRHDVARTEVEKVLRQRGALLRQVQGKRQLSDEERTTLDVWDLKLGQAGEALVKAREGLTDALQQRAAETYSDLAGAGVAGTSTGTAGVVGFTYQRSWEGPLIDALGAARADDVRRGVTTVGPHRDELMLSISGMPARTHASQGEQRSLALALRLAGHLVLTDRIGSPPILLLDDVFSELDHIRAGALLKLLPAGQAILTTATGAPPGATPEVEVRIEDGRIVP